MWIRHGFSTALSLGLLALQVCFAQAQQQPSETSSSTVSASGTSSSNSPTATSAPVASSTTVVSTITTTLSSGQSLPTSLRASASSSGSVWYIPVITAIPVTSTSSAPAATATSNTTAPASAASSNGTANALPLHTVIDPAFGVLGAILILTGLPMAFYGHRNRWSSYFLSGFFALALICISIILKVGVEPAVNPPSKAIRGLFLVAAVIAGAVGGVISIVFWRGAGLLACGLGGFVFGLFLQAVRPGGLIRPVGLRFILYVGLYAVFFTLSCYERAHSLVLALATAIIGATALTLGIDCFSTQGLKEFYIRNLGFDSLFTNKYPPTFQNGHFPLVQGMQIELGVLGALMLMGFAFQMRLWSDLRTQLSALKRSDERRNMRSKAERAARAVARTAKRDLEEWEARHGYSKTASRNVAGRDEEADPASPTTLDFKDSRSRTSSFMTLLRSNTGATQLPTPVSPTEKFARSPSASSVLDNSAYPFPPQSIGRRSSQFLDYIQKGPERVEPEGPLRLDLPAPLELGTTSAAPPALEAIPMSALNSGTTGEMPGSTPMPASQQPRSIDPIRPSPTEAPPGAGSFRQRSASTAALMDNSTSFMDLAPVKKEPSNPSSHSASLTFSTSASDADRRNNADRRTQSLSLTSASALISDAARSNQSIGFASHERTTSNPMAHNVASMAGAAPMTRSSSHQDQLQAYQSAVYAQPYREPYAEARQVQAQQSSNVASPGFGPDKTISGGQSSAVMQARRSLANRRNDQPTVPWTNPGAGDANAAHKRSKSADAQSRMRAMSIEELEARHRAKLAALQAPATQTVQDADALRRARDEWERKQRSERRRMQEREAQKAAAVAVAAAAAAGPNMNGSASNGRVASPTGSLNLHRAGSPGSRDERRRSRNLSATLLEAVGEEAQEAGKVNRAAEWRKSISGVEQLDPRAAKASNSSTPSGTRPTSPQPTSGLERALPSPFPLQPQESRKRLSQTDRRRLSQGAGRNSQPLLDFNLPNRNL